MSEDVVCRVCLVVNVRMCSIAGTPLQNVYEKLTDADLLSNGRPTAVCYMCCAKLRKTHQLMRTAVYAEEWLMAVIAKHSKVTAQSVPLVGGGAGLFRSMVLSAPECTNSPPQVDIKVEEESDDGLKDEEYEASDLADTDNDEPSDSAGETLSVAHPCKEEPLVFEEKQEDGAVHQASSPEDEARSNTQHGQDTRTPITEDTGGEGLSTSHHICQEETSDLTRLEDPLKSYTDMTHYEDTVKQNRSERDVVMYNSLASHSDEKHKTGVSLSNRKGGLEKRSKHHNVQKSFRCTICNKSFFSKHLLTRHRIKHSIEKPFECVVCAVKYCKKFTLKLHLKTHTEWKPFECNICKKTFILNIDYEKHMIVHEDRGTHLPKFECEWCQRIFKEKLYLERHLITHTGEKPFKCEICTRGFARRGTLQRHLLMHAMEKQFKCNICTKKYTTKYRLKEHLKNHTGGNVDPDSAAENDEEVSHRGEKPVRQNRLGTKVAMDNCLATNFDEKKHECGNRIKKSTKNYTNISEGKSNKFSSQDEKPDLKKCLKNYATQTPMQCDVCRKTFHRKFVLRRHMKIHFDEKTFECDICKAKYLYKSDLIRHMTKHTGRREYHCNLCSKKYTRNEMLQCHLRTHAGNRPFECEVCKSRFFRKYHMQKHLLSHTGEKPFKCDICQTQFSHKWALQRHAKRIHVEGRYFDCNICKKRFSNDIDLQKHMKMHVEKKQFECTFCKRIYNGSNTLQRHMKTHTGP